MNIIFMRHGEATDNIKELISDKEIYWSVLTENGKNAAMESVLNFPNKIDKIYVSPFPRTIETAHYICEKFPRIEVVIDNRIREINNGKYSHKKNNEDLDNTRVKQINGDYFTRFGVYGDNKYSIEKRLCEFLKDVYNNNFDNNTVVIVSHGSIISYMKRILKLDSPHIKTGKVEEFKNINFKNMFNHLKKLNKIKLEKIKIKKELIENLSINIKLKNNLIKMLSKEFNNIEFSEDVLTNYINGLSTKNLKKVKGTKFDKGIIVICFYNDFEKLASKWIEHYIRIGIKNFVLVDNNSSDNSTKILNNYSNDVNIEFWKIDEMYNCYKMCGWKQKLFEHYGEDNYFLTVDSDELFIYKNYKNISIEKFIEKKRLSFIKTLMLDVYTNKKVYEGNIEDFKYVDQNTYKTSNSVSYGARFFGGPRSRVLGINPSLQKIPFIKYTGREVYINDHFYYPWQINEKAKFCSYLLHYKFLPGDEIKYSIFAKDGRHWNDSREYKIYDKYENKNISFYDKDYSILVDDIKF